MRTTSASAQPKEDVARPRETTEVVFGGGANRGFFHVGLIRALATLHVAVGMVTGVSIGSIVAAFYANGYSADEILEIFIKELGNLPTPSLVRSLLLPQCVGKVFGTKTGRGLVDLPEVISRLVDVYDLKPQPNLRIIAFSLLTGKPVVFQGTDYNLVEAICASCAVPILMRPVWFGRLGKQRDPLSKLAALITGLTDVLVDGGVHHPCPGTFCEGKAIIGKLGFATALPKHRLSPTDTIMHVMEMLGAPLVNFFFPDPAGHIVIELGTPDVACLTFGLSPEQSKEMADHAENVALARIEAAIASGDVFTLS